MSSKPPPDQIADVNRERHREGQGDPDPTGASDGRAQGEQNAGAGGEGEEEIRRAGQATGGRRARAEEDEFGENDQENQIDHAPVGEQGFEAHPNGPFRRMISKLSTVAMETQSR